MIKRKNTFFLKSLKREIQNRLYLLEIICKANFIPETQQF